MWWGCKILNCEMWWGWAGLGSTWAAASALSGHSSCDLAKFCHRSHFGSRYTLGCCDLAGLFYFSRILGKRSKIHQARQGRIQISWGSLTFRWRPYRVECTGSLLTSEVKRHRARLVLGWGTAWEHPRVLPAFPHLLNALARPRRLTRELACI